MPQQGAGEAKGRRPAHRPPTGGAGCAGRLPYPTDLTDAEWQQIAPLLPHKVPRGQPPLHDRREVVNAILYLLHSDTAWRMLPHDFPPWQTVYSYFREWRQDGTWQQLRKVLAARRPRYRRPETPG